MTAASSSIRPSSWNISRRSCLRSRVMTPGDPLRRGHMRALMRFIDEMPAPAIRVPSYNLAFLPRLQKMTKDEFLAFAESKPLRKEFMLAMGQTGFPQKEMDVAMDRLRRTVRAHGRRDRRERRPVAARPRHIAGRCIGDAGDRAACRSAAAKHCGRTSRRLRAGSTISARIRPMPRPIITARISPSSIRICRNARTA